MKKSFFLVGLNGITFWPEWGLTNLSFRLVAWTSKFQRPERHCPECQETLFSNEFMLLGQVSFPSQNLSLSHHMPNTMYTQWRGIIFALKFLHRKKCPSSSKCLKNTFEWRHCLNCVCEKRGYEQQSQQSRTCSKLYQVVPFVRATWNKIQPR